MEYETPTPWRCDARFVLRGSLLSVLVGLVVGALLQLGGSSFEPIQLFLSALIAFFMFLVATPLPCEETPRARLARRRERRRDGTRPGD